MPVPTGSLPKVLHGLPISTGPLKSAVADRTMVLRSTPNEVPKALPIVLEIVTTSCVGLSPIETETDDEPAFG